MVIIGMSLMLGMHALIELDLLRRACVELRLLRSASVFLAEPIRKERVEHTPQQQHPSNRHSYKARYTPTSYCYSL